MRTYPLRTFVRRVLVVRLGIATAIIAVAVAAAAYVTQKARLENEVADLGRRGVATLVERVRSVMDREGADVVSALREVVGRGEQPVVYRAGRFVLFQVYDRSSTVLVEGVAGDQPDIAQIRTFMASQPLAFPAAGQDHVQAARINDGLLVYTVIPIVDRAGSVAAFARGMFAVSPEVAEQMRWTILLNVFLAVAIVVCVAALLFPVILHLTRRLADYSSHLLEANLEPSRFLGAPSPSVTAIPTPTTTGCPFTRPASARPWVSAGPRCSLSSRGRSFTTSANWASPTLFS